MDDMNAFDRQIANEVTYQAGPSRPVDVLGIVRTTTTQGSKTRFQTMFSATKFVVAGVIVAVFGGFLLAGVLTQRSEEPPPVGASASPVASPTHRVRLPAELPDDVRSGTLDTPLGPGRWIHLQETGPDELPWEPRPLPAPGGFIAVDQGENRGVNLWRSPDLIGWTAETLTIDAENPRLVLTGGTYWLIADEPEGLWRSEDTATWQQLDLSELASPFPEGLDARIAVLPPAGPVSSAGVTIVRLDFWPDGAGSYLGLPGLDGQDWGLLESSEPGVYEAVVKPGMPRETVSARLRFEETATGLRVIDATHDAKLSELDGVHIDFIERWAQHGYLERIIELAIVEGDTLVPVDRPGSPDQELEVFGTAGGFVAYGIDPDSDLVQVWYSSDGVAWSESQPLGDEPGEPVGVEGMWLDAQRAVVNAEGGGRGWTSSDGVTWREFPRLEPEPEGAVRLDAGWLMLSMNELSFKGDGDDEWTTTDVTELDIDADEGHLFWNPDLPGTDSIRDAPMYIYAIGPDSIAAPIESPGDSDRRKLEVFIFTFDDLSG